MIKQRDKTSPKLLNRTNEISSATLNCQPTSRSSFFDISKTKTKAKTSSETSASFEDPRQKISEGVRKFMKQVSKCVEKKNSHKIMHSFKKPRENFNSVLLNDESSQENFHLRNKNKETVVKEKNIHYLMNLKRDKSALAQPSPKTLRWSPQSKRNRLDSCAIKRNQSGKNYKQEFLPTCKQSAEFNQPKALSGDFRLGVEKKKESIQVSGSQEAVSKDATNKLVQPKRRKRSEIPLRKNRTDVSRKPKAVSTLLQKPVKEVESAAYVNFYSKKKPFSPIEEVDLCSDIHNTINATTSSDKLNDDGKTADSNSLKTREEGLNIKLDRCCKNPNITIASTLSSNEFLEEKYSTGRKAKILDLDKVKTSSFTVLHTSPAVLDRLESLHKQNILAKKKLNAVGSKKPKPLTSKNSLNSLKSRSSRKNLSSSLNCKRNKSGQKIRVKKSRKEIRETTNWSEKCSQAMVNSPHHNIFTKLFAAGKAHNLLCDNLKAEIRTSEVLNTKQNCSAEENTVSLPTNSVRHGDKTFSRKLRSPREKEESKIPKSQKYAASSLEFHNVKKWDEPKSPSNRTPNKKLYWSILTNESVGSLRSEINTPEQSLVFLRNFESKRKEYDKRSSTAVICESQPTQSSLGYNNKLEKSITLAKRKSAAEKKIEMTKAGNSALVIRGTALNLVKNDLSEKQDSLRTKTKMQLKIDLNLQNASEETSKNIQSCDWLFKNDVKKNDEIPVKEENFQSDYCDSPDSLSSKCVEKLEKSEPSRNLLENNFNFPETSKSCLFLKRKFFSKVSLVTKGARKKLRSDAGDRPISSFTSFISSNLSLQNKTKFETKLRNGLTRSYNEEQQKDTFEEGTLLKLRRRHSEPSSFTGYIWKRTDFPTFRGHKPSVSSVASSLKHLNTDDIDDFIFWEPVPPKMTSCWEMSLYHFKKPWTVLSCSVFRDNRLSNTPGLILENLRNRGNFSTRQSAGSQSGGVNYAKENPFDVEPSIAQKNIDIRNWLAALNFPTPNSNSSDVISEGIFNSQTLVDSQNLNKAQVNQKRRKLFRNIKFLDEPSDLKTKDKKQYTRWDANEAEGLRDLVRRKSGGFVIKELHVDSEYFTYRPNAALNSCLASKTAEEKSISRETNDRNIASESKVFKKPELSCQPAITETETEVNAAPPHSTHLAKQCSKQPLKTMKKFDFGKILKGDSIFLFTDFNIWKYLFVFTLFIVIIHYYFLRISVSPN